jgi:hypothetical protein
LPDTYNLRAVLVQKEGRDAGTPWVIRAPEATPETAITPASGPLVGNTTVRITSTALFPADFVACAFGPTSVPGTIRIAGSVQPGTSAQLLQLLALTCKAPPTATPAAVALRVTLTSGTFINSFDYSYFTFYNAQRIVDLEKGGQLSIEPPWIDVSGSDNITIRGAAIFSPADTPRLRLTADAAVPAAALTQAAPERMAAEAVAPVATPPANDWRSLLTAFARTATLPPGRVLLASALLCCSF